MAITEDQRPSRATGDGGPGFVHVRGAREHNLKNVDVDIPRDALVAFTGISGSGKSSLAFGTLYAEAQRRYLESVSPYARRLFDQMSVPDVDTIHGLPPAVALQQQRGSPSTRSSVGSVTTLSNLLRILYSREGFVEVELLFLPTVYAPCPVCHGSRYNAKTLEVHYRGKSVADVLGMTVAAAREFFRDEPRVCRALDVLQEVGVGYLRLGQPATELSGGEAQRIKLATELQRIQRGDALYILDEPTTGLHAADVERLMAQLHGLVDAGNTMVVVEHEMRIVAGGDWVIDIGPGAGEEGGRVVAAGTPTEVARAKGSRTAPYLARFLSVTA